ncbi:hypothetical protein GYB29_16310 [bacterium]|jgi:hypothetical protein|nr:hypothetical protein [bacterium]
MKPSSLFGKFSSESLFILFGFIVAFAVSWAFDFTHGTRIILGMFDATCPPIFFILCYYSLKESFTQKNLLVGFKKYFDLVSISWSIISGLFLVISTLFFPEVFIREVFFLWFLFPSIVILYEIWSILNKFIRKST